MIPVDQAEVVATRNEADTAIFHCGVVQQELTGDLEVACKETPEHRILMVAVGSRVGWFGEHLIVIEFDI